MNFTLSDEQMTIKQAIERICALFGDDYWLAHDNDGKFPEEFVKAITDGGWLGIAMPEAFGGAGLGITEASILAHTIARSGAGMSGASAIHLNLFGPNPIVVFGSEEQKQRFLPPLIKGQDRACFGVTLIKSISLTRLRIILCKIDPYNGSLLNVVKVLLIMPEA